MPSFSAKFDQTNPAPRQVVFVIYPNIVLLDLAGPLQVFDDINLRQANLSGYKPAIVSLHGGIVPTDTIVTIESEMLEAWLDRDIHTLIIVGGNGANTAMLDEELLHGVRRLASRAHRICSVCSGALILAAAGLLDGHRVTTHWEDSDHLARDFPRVEVDDDPIYIKDGNIWTSAGVTSGIDMALAIVAEDLGHAVALQQAQTLVTYMVRPGGQSQFSPVLARQKKDRSARFEALHSWIENNLTSDLRVDKLADHQNMSPRNFHRLYTQTMGITPAKAVEKIRMEVARDLLETSLVGIKSVAGQCGFGDEERMRRAFIRHLGVSPSDYRRRFQAVD